MGRGVMGDVQNLRHKRLSPFVLITLDWCHRGPKIEVCAWTGAPSDPGVARMYLGSRDTVSEAAALAHGKAAQHGIHEIVDFTDAQSADRPEGDAA